MTITDRLGNVPEDLAIKAPCLVATTGNIVLSGLQTIDGVALAANQRVLVYQQTDATQNGIYQASTGPWTRPNDANGNEAWIAGSQVYVQQGSQNGGITFVQTCLDDPVIVGTSHIAFSPAGVLAVGQLNGTSATAQAIGTGAMSFVTQQGKLWLPGNWVQIASRSNTITTYMVGQVTSYAGTTLNVAVTQSLGAGSHSDWNIALSGPPGAQGLAGDPHAFDTRGAAAAATISGTVNFLRTAGLVSIGDGGEALYYRVGGSTTGGFQSADGAWWAVTDPNFVPPWSGSVTRTIFDRAIDSFNLLDFIPLAEHAAIRAGTSTYDAGPAVNAAIAAAAGRKIKVPAGTYLIQTQIKYVNPAASGLTYGVVLEGDGMNTTIFQNTIAGVQLTSAFSVTNLSTIVTLAWPAHGKAVNDVITLINLGSSSYGGLDMEGNWGVTSVTTDTLTFNHYAAATSTVTTTGTVTATKAMMSLDTAGAFMVGTRITGLQVQNSGSPVGSSAIRLRRNFQFSLDNLWINGATCDGLQIPCVLGDADSSAQLRLGSVRINGCGRWGIDMAASQTTVGGVLTGHNEISNSVLENVTIDTCGTAQSVYQRGGGLKWKGQGLHFNSFACVTCSNCAIYIPGGAGLPSAVSFDFLALENNTGRQFVIEGLDTLNGRILEMYNNDSFVATTGLYLNAAASVVGKINIGSSIVRATAGNNAYTAFVATGADLGTVRIYTPSFQDFGHAGQAQESGVIFLT